MNKKFRKKTKSRSRGIFSILEEIEEDYKKDPNDELLDEWINAQKHFIKLNKKADVGEIELASNYFDLYNLYLKKRDFTNALRTAKKAQRYELIAFKQLDQSKEDIENVRSIWDKKISMLKKKQTTQS